MSWFRTISAVKPYTNYYVANEGSPSNNGLSPSEPLDIQGLQALSLSNKIRPLFKRGQTHEIGGFDFDTNDSAIGRYGAGSAPVLTGSEDISGATWTDEGSGIYSTPIANFKWLFINGLAARLGQSAWIQSTALPSTTVIRGNSATLNAFSSLIGAKLRVFELPWVMGEELTITNYDSGTGNITLNASYGNLATPSVGVYFVIYGQLQFVTQNNDWYYDGTDLYIKSSVNPSTLDIRASIHDTGINLTGENLSISGIEMKHYNYGIQAANGVAQEVNIDDVLITDCKQAPVKILGSNGGRKRNLRWERIGSTGAVFTGSNSEYTNLTGDLVGMDGNWPMPDGTYRGAGNGFVLIGNHNKITYLNCSNTAYNGASISGAHNIHKKMIFDGVLKRFQDGGGFYTSGNSSTPNESTNYDGILEDVIVKNITTAVEGSLVGEAAVGIYMDNRTDNFRLQGNISIEGGNYGLLANWNSRFTVGFNLHIVGASIRQVLYRQDTDPGDSPLFPNNNGNVLSGCILANRSASALCVEARDRNNTTTFNPFSSGDSDSNHYVSPYSVNIAGYRPTEAGSLTSYTLSGWRTKMGDDALSTERTNYLTFSSAANALEEVKIEFNETDEPVEFTVPAGYSDEEGNAFDNPVTIPAYGSLVYFKDEEV